MRDELEQFWSVCEAKKLRALWEIFFQTGIRVLDLLESRFYLYGCLLHEHDYLGREIFLFLVALLKHLGDR